MPRRTPARTLTMVTVMLAFAAAGCVTERIVRPARSPVPAVPTTPALPPDPPIIESTPIGSIPFDGITLPIISPDGAYIATQVGQAPSWAGMLATPGDPITNSCRIAVYARTDAGITPTEAAPPRGLLLGRSADEAGFLVEQPRPDGSRRIGRCDWVNGGVEWLIDEPGRCCAHAIVLRDGTRAFSRRDVGRARAELVIVPGADASGAAREPAVITLPDASLMFPLATPGQRHIAAIASSREGLELVAVALDGPWPPAISMRCRISANGQARAAYQAVAAVHAAPPEPVGGSEDDLAVEALREVFQVYSARFVGAVLIGARDGQVTRLADESRATCLTPRPPLGVLLTRSDLSFLEVGRPGALPIRAARQALIVRAPDSRGRSGWEVLAFGPDELAAEPTLIITQIRGYLRPKWRHEGVKGEAGQGG